MDTLTWYQKCSDRNTYKFKANVMGNIQQTMTLQLLRHSDHNSILDGAREMMKNTAERISS